MPSSGKKAFPCTTENSAVSGSRASQEHEQRPCVDVVRSHSQHTADVMHLCGCVHFVAGFWLQGVGYNTRLLGFATTCLLGFGCRGWGTKGCRGAWSFKPGLSAAAQDGLIALFLIALFYHCSQQRGW